jgi:hypothetical protein
MSSVADPPSRNTFTAGSADAPGKTRKLPVLPSSIPSAQSTGDAMEVTPPASASTGPAPPAHSSPDSDRAGANITNSNGSVETGNMNNTSMPNQAIGAAAAAQQPKVVQTAFIHKLYKYVCSDSVRSDGCLKPFLVLHFTSAPLTCIM